MNNSDDSNNHNTFEHDGDSATYTNTADATDRLSWA